MTIHPSATALAQTADVPTLEQCTVIGAPADRLTCYDEHAGRAPVSGVPVTQVSVSGSVSPATPARLRRVRRWRLPPGQRANGPTGLSSKFWELEPSDKRGTFNFVGYRPSYALPLHVASRINQAPSSPTRAVVAQPDYRREEGKFQLSLRAKVVQDTLLPDADLWVGFTQQALWQIWNGKDSKPFRNSDYEPEIMYILPTGKGLRDLPFGWQWRYTQLGLAHQSNGQADPLSRSWNRVYLGTGIERGDWTLTARLTQRLNESIETDNNPDLVKYRGRGEFALGWAHGLQTTLLQYRSTLKSAKYGAVQLDWTYPVSRDQPNGLRWFVQAFHGYGETLTDYNFRQTSVGVGVGFFQF